MQPKWLGGKDGYFGRCSGFIEGQGERPAAIIKLDEQVAFDGSEGNILVLELRYVGARWGKRETVHLELCDFMPENKAWNDRKRGEWIESHASYEVVGDD